ncbi:MAG: hypothetical protein IPF99_25740 [Deltaproteobacteria bacterium]|nr:hypothetical protein [Deltaproteobacteria bacterium]
MRRLRAGPRLQRLSQPLALHRTEHRRRDRRLVGDAPVAHRLSERRLALLVQRRRAPELSAQRRERSLRCRRGSRELLPPGAGRAERRLLTGEVDLQGPQRGAHRRGAHTGLGKTLPPMGDVLLHRRHPGPHPRERRLIRTERDPLKVRGRGRARPGATGRLEVKPSPSQRRERVLPGLHLTSEGLLVDRLAFAVRPQRRLGLLDADLQREGLPLRPRVRGRRAGEGLGVHGLDGGARGHPGRRVLRRAAHRTGLARHQRLGQPGRLRLAGRRLGASVLRRELPPRLLRVALRRQGVASSPLQSAERVLARPPLDGALLPRAQVVDPRAQRGLVRQRRLVRRDGRVEPGEGERRVGERLLPGDQRRLHPIGLGGAVGGLSLQALEAHGLVLHRPERRCARGRGPDRGLRGLEVRWGERRVGQRDGQPLVLRGGALVLLSTLCEGDLQGAQPRQSFEAA